MKLKSICLVSSLVLATPLAWGKAVSIDQVAACDNARARVFELYRDRINGAPANLSATIVHPKLDALLIGEIGKVATRLSATRLQGLSVADGDYGPAEDESDPQLQLARLEARSRLEPEYDIINARLDAALSELKASSLENRVACDDSVSEKSPEVKTQSASADPGIVYGAHKTMATAYQSCRVLDLPPVTNAVQVVEGVKRDQAIDSVGWGRKYTDVVLLKKTHYYHEGLTYAGACKSQNAKPLVYDYGGVPVFASSQLNLFSNSGGGPALGIDCSAFVSSAAAVSGHLYSASSSDQPVYRRFVSRDFINPKTSNWSCYDQVQVDREQGLVAGDIAAVKGHIVIVDSVGRDPFGLTKATTASACENLQVKNFDFVLVQSSSSKEHLGINRYEASEYLVGEARMASLFKSYAKAACLSRLDGKKRNGSTTEFGLVRHRSNEGCLAKSVTLVNEACVERCARK